MTIVVGFDLGSREAGCVVLEDGVVRSISAWSAPTETGWKSLEARLQSLSTWETWHIWETHDRHPIIAVEGVHLIPGRPRAVVVLSECIGGLIAVAPRGRRIIRVRPAEGKKALTGVGYATKEAMVAAAQAQFPGHEWNEHTADALGVALAAAGKLKLEAMAKEEGDEDRNS